MFHIRKYGLGGAESGQAHHPSRNRPRVNSIKEAIRSNAGLLQKDLYLNPDNLVRLIGEPNEAKVKLEGQNFNALVDSGSMVSKITLALANVLKLPM